MEDADCNHFFAIHNEQYNWLFYVLHAIFPCICKNHIYVDNQMIHCTGGISYVAIYSKLFCALHSIECFLSNIHNSKY